MKRPTGRGPEKTIPIELLVQATALKPLIERRECGVENTVLESRQLTSGPVWNGLVGQHPSLRKIFSEVEKVARIPGITVLITGESGTGKELVAKALHRLSFGRDKPFVEVNSSAIPDNLLEAELFGHERGAFTDAKTQRKGLLEVAHGGTLFLDEIGHMSPTLQVKLLKVIEEKSFRPLGSTEEKRMTARIVAATNLDLEQAVREGGFRHDLYYRLSVFSIHIPPLRERESDILLLAEHFLEQFSRQHRTAAKNFSAEARQLLLDYSWPGNVRELKNTIERAVLVNGRHTLYPEDLATDRRISERRRGEGQTILSLRDGERLRVKLPSQGLNLEKLEKEILRAALSQTGGNLSRAARLIGLSRDTLRYRIKKYKLQVNGRRSSSKNRSRNSRGSIKRHIGRFPPNSQE
jgi:DNA-binding NtrC family response regulator